MSLSTPMKEAIKQWELKNDQKVNQATEIKLNGILPPLDKMDPSLLSFHNCEKLSLSSNCIERLANMSSLKRLRILSLGRNNIKSISGLETVAETLEELWISYNQIEKLKGIGYMKKLRVLTMSNNNVREWVEFGRLAELPALKEAVFIGNPLEEKCSAEGTWRSEVARRLPTLSKLDGYQLTDCDLQVEKDLDEDDDEAAATAAAALPKSQFGAEEPGAIDALSDEQEENPEAETEDSVDESQDLSLQQST